MAEPFLERNVHPTVINRAFMRALEEAIKVIDGISFNLDVNDRGQMLNVINSCLGTKYTHRFGGLMAELGARDGGGNGVFCFVLGDGGGRRK